jgi:hypothetical protein
MVGIDKTHTPSSLRDVERCGSIHGNINQKKKFVLSHKLRQPFLRFGFWITIQNVKRPASINKSNSCIIVGRSKIQSNNSLATYSIQDRNTFPRSYQMQKQHKESGSSPICIDIILPDPRPDPVANEMDKNAIIITLIPNLKKTFSANLDTSTSLKDQRYRITLRKHNEKIVNA